MIKITTFEDIIRAIFDGDWYRSHYPDIANTGIDPLAHYLSFGLAEGRDPNRFFDSHWYRQTYPDVAAAGIPPFLHYLQFGASELRNPHPRFDAAYYVFFHPEAAGNPLFFHATHGAAQGFATTRGFDIAAYLPAPGPPPALPAGLLVDVIIPVYRGLGETRRCLVSVLADHAAPRGDVIVIDDCSPEPALSAWLDRLNETGAIRLIRPPRNLGFVAAVNRGIQAAGDRDVALLNSDTEVPRGWLARLAAHAYAGARIATVSPFSNNATICSYPNRDGGDLAFGADLAAIDAATRAVNVGRSVEIPVTVGSCMYIRRAAIDEIGDFDREYFGHGYGEEVDFCLRASARGWRHLLACDVFIYHAGEVSFGNGSDARDEGMRRVAERYPHFPRTISFWVRFGVADSARFALSAELFRRSGLPTILMVSHDLGGGIERHLAALGERLESCANVLLLRPESGGFKLSIPGLPGHPDLAMNADRVEDFVVLLKNFALRRVHVHHVMRFYDADLAPLLRRLGVPFDVTIHDYYAICPQVNLLPWLDAQYCGEPGPAACNACIAARPSHGARDILEWRARHRFLFTEADRVLCPSEDARARLARHGLAARAIVAPHEGVTAPHWPLRINPLPRAGARKRALRVALLGVLASQKGLPAVAALAATMAAEIDLHLIGYPEAPLPAPLAERLAVSGEYAEADLPRLITRLRPHALWFPAQWPETWSYTLSAAIASGLPIVASRIGAFPERLAGRPLTWLVPPEAPPEAWRAAFAALRDQIARTQMPPKSPRRRQEADFYEADYIAPLKAHAAEAARRDAGPRDAGPRDAGPRDLRRPGKLAVILVPERLAGGVLSPCAYIRLALPLDHPEIAAAIEVTHASPEEALHLRADVIATQRYAITDIDMAAALGAHCRQFGMRLVYDLDDDLLAIPPGHPEAALLGPRSAAVARMLDEADQVSVSTPALRDRVLRARLGARIGEVQLVVNGLDERLWQMPRPPRAGGALRLLLMGTTTHEADFRLIAGVLARLKEDFGERVEIEVCGMTHDELPPRIQRIAPPPGRGEGYPGFIAWLASRPGWHLGLAPLAAGPFNDGKSAIKAFDYAALGLAVLASDVPAYRGSLADGPGGWLVGNTEEAWYQAVARLIRDPALCARLAAGARAAYLTTGTLAVQAARRRAAWHALAAPVKPDENRAAPMETKPAHSHAALVRGMRLRKSARDAQKARTAKKARNTKKD